MNHGYTTEFSGQINLSRKLTMKEAKEWMEIADKEDPDLVWRVFGVNTYLQWVPTETLDAIVWDGGEKFYDYFPLLATACDVLKEKGIDTNGVLVYSGEAPDDSGRLVVVHGEVVRETLNTKAVGGRPLTMKRLGEMALEQIAGD